MVYRVLRVGKGQRNGILCGEVLGNVSVMSCVLRRLTVIVILNMLM
jgi:flagellar biosynthesis/type III secretory pathway ATPase